MNRLYVSFQSPFSIKITQSCALLLSYFLLFSSTVTSASTAKICREIYKNKLLAVTVARDGNAETYMRTNRGLKELRGLIRTTGYLNESEINRGLGYLSKRFLKGKRVLDAGTGDGATVEDLRKLGADAVGTDIHLSPQQKTKAYFKEQDTTELQFQDANFDVVMSNYSVFHYAESRDVVRNSFLELKRVLKPGGYLILSGNRRFSHWNTENKADYSDLEVVGVFHEVQIYRKLP